MRWITIVAVTLVASGTARAHVQASPNENNRYLHLTPMGDRVRFVYTIYFGETPGAALRREIDTGRDGTVDDSEADAFGRRIAQEVGPALDLTLDGRPVAFAWSEVEVGMGTPEVTAGSFAIDLVGEVCLPGRGAHELVVRDDYRLPIPGETELKVETGLGVTLDRMTLAGAMVNGDDVKLRGTAGPLATGWSIKLTIGEAAPVGGPTCGRAPASGTRKAAGPWVIAGIAGLAMVGGLTLFALHRRRRSRATRG